MIHASRRATCSSIATHVAVNQIRLTYLHIRQSLSRTTFILATRPDNRCRSFLWASSAEHVLLCLAYSNKASCLSISLPISRQVSVRRDQDQGAIMLSLSQLSAIVLDSVEMEISSLEQGLPPLTVVNKRSRRWEGPSLVSCTKPMSQWRRPLIFGILNSSNRVLDSNSVAPKGGLVEIGREFRPVMPVRTVFFLLSARDLDQGWQPSPCCPLQKDTARAGSEKVWHRVIADGWTASKRRWKRGCDLRTSLH